MGSRVLKIGFFTLIACAFGFQIAYAPKDASVLKEQLNGLPQELNTANTLLYIAESFVTAPYEGGTLESPEEQLVINLRTFDCWTFVESCIGILHVSQGNTTNAFDALCEKIKTLRYRDGILQGYGSRIHYFAEWMQQAEQNGFVQDITKQIGGLPYEKKIAFMSQHPAYYPKLKNTKTKAEIIKAEQKIQASKFNYIPKKNVQHIESELRDGDIIAITATKKDLDVVHEGFACWHNGRIHLVHASSDGKQVMMSPEPLHDYLAQHHSQSGIMVGRVFDKKQ